MNLKTCGALLMLASLPVTALAQSATPDSAKEEARAKFRAACAADAQKFCANVERAKGAMRACLDVARDAAVGQLQGRKGRAGRCEGEGEKLISEHRRRMGRGGGYPRPGLCFEAAPIARPCGVQQLPKDKQPRRISRDKVKQSGPPGDGDGSSPALALDVGALRSGAPRCRAAGQPTPAVRMERTPRWPGCSTGFSFTA